MYTTLRSFILAALWVTGSLAAVPAVKRTYTRCGTEEPSADLVAAAHSLATNPQPLAAAAATLNVNAYFHVVTSSSKVGRYSQTQLNNQVCLISCTCTFTNGHDGLCVQIAYMNRAYAPCGISFTLVGSDFTTNNNWATGNYDSTMKPALRKGTYKDLNVYFLSDLGGGLLGICNFPTNAAPGSSTYNQDGCDVLADSLPGGSATNYNLGGTAAHEVGHWFGLFHVFQGQACTGSGDSVSDTPIQKIATSGCPSSQDSCPNQSGLDNIHNYMDYSDDVW